MIRLFVYLSIILNIFGAFQRKIALNASVHPFRPFEYPSQKGATCEIPVLCYLCRLDLSEAVKKKNSQKWL